MSDAPSAGRFEGREHCLAVRVYYEDTDFTGVVYHANYVRYFERGRSDFLRLIGIGHAELLARPDPCAFVITRLAIAFHRAARIDDCLLYTSRWRCSRSGSRRRPQSRPRAGSETPLRVRSRPPPA